MGERLSPLWIELPFWSGMLVCSRFPRWPGLTGQCVGLVGWSGGQKVAGDARPTAVLTERCFVCGCCCAGAGVGCGEARLVGPVQSVRLCAVPAADGDWEDLCMFRLVLLRRPGVYGCT